MSVRSVTTALTSGRAFSRRVYGGSVVNGPGEAREAREADPGVASGRGTGQIVVEGEVIATVPEPEIVETLIDEAMKTAASTEAAGTPSGAPAVTVS